MAADRIVYAPPEAWVATTDPQGPAAPADGAAGQEAAPAIELLIADTQARFNATTVSEYARIVLQVKTAEGLAAGGMTQEWDPATDTLVVHRLQVRRDGRVIDVLRDQKFEVLRRERNLEQAMLDGRLTATLQIADLRVGDIIDYALTITRAQPVLAGRYGELSIFSPQSRVGKARVRYVWDTARPFHWRAGDGLPKPTVSEQAGLSELRLEVSNFRAPEPPENAPVRYRLGGLLEASQLDGWRDASAAFRPLYDAASTLEANSPLKAEIERIRKAGATPEARAALALQLVEDQVRYVAISINAQGYTPAKADETWRRRFGDCKGKTALLMALLRELGIEATPVLVSTGGGESLKALLPRATAFDHVLVRAQINGKTYWLDGTRTGDGPIEALTVPDLDWGLPLTAQGSDLTPMKPPRPERPEIQYTLRIDASKGLDKEAPVELEVIVRDDGLGASARGYQAMTANDVRRSIINTYDDGYRWVNFTEATWRFDAAAAKMVFKLKGVGSPIFTTSNQRNRYEIPGSALFAPNVKLRPSDQDADAPYRARTPSYERSVTVITLPSRTGGLVFGGTAKFEKSGGVQRTRWGRKVGGTVTVVTAVRAADDEVSAAQMAKDVADARRYQATVLTLNWPTEPEPVAAKDAPPENQLRLISREMYEGVTPPPLNEAQQTVMREWQEAAGAGNHRKALAILDAGQAKFAGREEELALARVEQLIQMDRYGEAIALLDQTPSRTEPEAINNLVTRTYLDMRLGRTDGAAKRVNAALERRPDSAALIWLAVNGRFAGAEYEDALRLHKRVLALQPDEPQAWTQLAAIYTALGRWDEALAAYADAEEAGVQGPILGRIKALASTNQAEAARAEVARYVARDPNDANTLNNACWGRATADFDLPAALADCEKAVSLSDVAAHRDSLAFVKLRMGQPQQAVAEYDRALAKNGRLGPSLYGRGIAKLRLGQTAAGQADLAAARKVSPYIDNEFKLYGVTP